MSDQGNLKKSEKKKSEKKKSEKEKSEKKEVEKQTNNAEGKPDKSAQLELEKDVEKQTSIKEEKPDKSVRSKSEKKEEEIQTNNEEGNLDESVQSKSEKKEVETQTNNIEGNLEESRKAKNVYVGGSDSNQYSTCSSQVNKQTVHAEDEQSVNSDSGKQNSSDQTSGILDVETVKRIVKEELSKDKRSMKMQTGAIM